MNRKIIPAVVILLALAAALPAAAQSAGTRIAIANPAKIFNEMHETNDLKKKLAGRASDLQNEFTRRSADVEKIKKSRDQLNTDAPQFGTLNQQLLQASMELKVWQEMQQNDLGRDQKQQMKSLMDKIVLAIKEVADAEKIDIVIAEQAPEIPDLDSLDVNQLRALINSRNILYTGPNAIDLTQKVTAALDAKYLQAAPTAPTAPPK